MSLREVNSLDRAGFVEALGPVFEGPPWIVEQAWDARPFRNLDHLHQALRAVMDGAPLAQQIALLRAHPDLAGRAALAGTLTPHSQAEQASADLDRLTAGEIDAFRELNAAYRGKFGFPFVICVRENRKESILAGLRQRLGGSREDEIRIALGEVAKISRLRLLESVEEGAR